jgi:hypothetical protein
MSHPVTTTLLFRCHGDRRAGTSIASVVSGSSDRHAQQVTPSSGMFGFQDGKERTSIGVSGMEHT